MIKTLSLNWLKEYEKLSDYHVLALSKRLIPYVHKMQICKCKFMVLMNLLIQLKKQVSLSPQSSTSHMADAMNEYFDRER